MRAYSPGIQQTVKRGKIKTSTVRQFYADFSHEMSGEVSSLSAAAPSSSLPQNIPQAQPPPIAHDHVHSADNCPLCRQQSENFAVTGSKVPGRETTEAAARVRLSPEAQARQGQINRSDTTTQASTPQEEAEETSTQTPNAATEPETGEQRQVEELKLRDREVRAHEAAHAAAAGQHARGGPSYTYQRGPDGVQYAVGGEVPIDVSPVPNDPQATIQKALTIRRAALAPADPSGADRQIAARASAMAAQARQELVRQSQESGTSTDAHSQQVGEEQPVTQESDDSHSPAPSQPAENTPESSLDRLRGVSEYAQQQYPNQATPQQPVLSISA